MKVGVTVAQMGGLTSKPCFWRSYRLDSKHSSISSQVFLQQVECRYSLPLTVYLLFTSGGVTVVMVITTLHQRLIFFWTSSVQ
jgi:hypothetical protein